MMMPRQKLPTHGLSDVLKMKSTLKASLGLYPPSPTKRWASYNDCDDGKEIILEFCSQASSP